MAKKRQWFIAGGIVTMALLVLIGEIIQIRHVVGKSPNAYQSMMMPVETIPADQDTDGDGIPDIVELTITHTSPYLADTDGDGIPDGEEIRRGTDPLCPEGKTCPSSTIVPGNTPPPRQPKQEMTFVKELYNPNAASGGSLQQITPPPANQDDTNAALLNGTATPTQIRALLIRSGMSPETVNGLSDDQLQKTYQETIQQLNAAPPSGNP